MEAARPAEPRAPGRFEIDYLTSEVAVDGAALEEAWAAPLEDALPVRRFAARKGQRHLSGLWWSATTGGHVGFESWLERPVDRTNQGQALSMFSWDVAHGNR